MVHSTFLTRKLSCVLAFAAVFSMTDEVSATPLSALINTSVTVNGLTFTFNEYLLNPAGLDVQFFGGPHYAGFSVVPLGGSSVWTATGPNASAFSGQLDYSVTAASGWGINSVALGGTFYNVYSNGSYEHAAASLTDPHAILADLTVSASGCLPAPDFGCNGNTLVTSENLATPVSSLLNLLTDIGGDVSSGSGLDTSQVRGVYEIFTTDLIGSSSPTLITSASNSLTDLNTGVDTRPALVSLSNGVVVGLPSVPEPEMAFPSLLACGWAALWRTRRTSKHARSS